MNGDLEGPAANTLIPFLCLSNGAFGKSVTDRDVFLHVCVCAPVALACTRESVRRHSAEPSSTLVSVILLVVGGLPPFRWIEGV